MPKFKNNQPQRLYRFEVDQSVRIEELNRDSTVGIANKDHSYTVNVSKRVKRRLQECFRQRGKPKQFGPQVFTASVIVAIR